MKTIFNLLVLFFPLVLFSCKKSEVPPMGTVEARWEIREQAERVCYAERELSAETRPGKIAIATEKWREEKAKLQTLRDAMSGLISSLDMDMAETDAMMHMLKMDEKKRNSEEDAAQKRERKATEQQSSRAAEQLSQQEEILRLKIAAMYADMNTESGKSGVTAKPSSIPGAPSGMDRPRNPVLPAGMTNGKE
jgi:hypothetical protein